MSRVGNLPIQIPSGVNIEVSKSNVVTVKGPKGELSEAINPDMTLKIEDGQMKVSRPTDQKRHRAMHGLCRALIGNMVDGVNTGFTKELELVGVGYRVSNAGNLLEISVGYSHPIYFYIPDEIKVEAVMEKGKNPRIILNAIDKQLIGQIAAKLRAIRKPEPYKGKGIRYVGEEIRRKAGKTAG
jgi:large subunit ribosomal protein L6